MNFRLDTLNQFKGISLYLIDRGCMKYEKMMRK